MTKHYLSTALTDKITDNADRDSRPSADVALLIDEQLCLNLRGRSLSCEACAKQCPVGALQLSTDRVAVNADDCSTCGACLPACPSGVFRLHGFSPLHFLHGLKNDGEIHIHCDASASKDDDVALPCLHLLDTRLISAAFAAGVKTFHLDGLSHCEQCDKGNAVTHMLATQNRLMQWFGVESSPRLFVATLSLSAWVAEQHRHKEPDIMSRRQFFRQAGRRAVASASPRPAPVANDDEASWASQTFQQSNTRQQRAAEYQSILAARAAELPWQRHEIPWHKRSIDNDACNACLVCGQRCPTGALQSEQTTAGRSISFSASLCTDCGLCTQLCPTDAIKRITIKDTADITAVRSVLMYQHHQTCQHCAQDFLPQTEDETLCLACNNEQALESEWLAHCAH